MWHFRSEVLYYLAHPPDPAIYYQFGHRLLRLFLLALVLGGFVGATVFWYGAEVFQWFLVPAGDRLSPFEGGLPVFTAPHAMLLMTFKMAVYAAVVVGTGTLAVGLYRMVARFLSRRARWLIKLILLVMLLLYVGGAAFVYYVVLPRGLSFLLGFGTEVAIPVISITEYLELAVQLMFWVGVVFELPLVMWVLSRFRIVPYRRMRKIRPVVPFFASVIAVIITPTVDPINAGLVAIPIFLLYEVGLFAAWLARPEEGNYLWLKTFKNAVVWVLRRPIVLLSAIGLFLRRQGL